MSITRKIPASTPPRRFLPKFFKTGKACGGNNSPRTPLFLPPGFAGSAGQDEREDYARGQGGGGGVQSEGRFSTLWGPGRRQEHGRRQARSRNSVPALSAAAVVQARQFVQRVLRKRACVFFGRPARSEIIPPAPPCFCLPASPVRQDRMNGKIMPEAKGEGGECSRKAVFRRSGGPGRRQEHGRRQARSRNSVPALSAAAVVQARQFVQHVLPKRACVFFGRRKFGKTGTARGGAWRTLFGLRTQCRCVLTDSPAVADSCPAFAGQS